MYGWFGTIADFLNTSPEAWLATVQTNYHQLYRQRSARTQNQAWQDCGQVLRSQFLDLVNTRPNSASWSLIFEYELPGEGGRRPDLVLLGAGQVLVFEFKQKERAAIADLDQAAAYARDLAEYHGGCAGHPVTAIVVPTRAVKEQVDKVEILCPDAIAPYLATLAPHPPEIDANAWINADYEPLPTVIQSARRIFQQEPLPSIKRARSAGIPDLLNTLNQLIQTAQQRQEKHLVLITGVPGAGKTLVGLQFVYQNILIQDDKRNALFLYGAF
jgi:hypothetical protein